MNTRSVTLKTYPCGTLVLEVLTTALPKVEPAAVEPEPRELVPA